MPNDLFTPLACTGLVLAGAAWWTLLEYLLHRFAFHDHPKRFGKRHFAHHANTTVPLLAIAPPRSALGGAVVHAAIAFPLLGRVYGTALFAGFLVGYVAYEVIHWAIHFREPRTAWGRGLRDHHLLHHDGTPRARYGVSTLFWDRVFRTLPKDS